MTLSNALADVKNLGVVSYNGQIVVSSRDVAAVFEKEHKNVIQSIRNLGCSEGFAALSRLSSRGYSVVLCGNAARTHQGGFSKTLLLLSGHGFR